MGLRHGWKRWPSLWVLAVCMALPGAAVAEGSPSGAMVQPTPADVEAFVREGCPHCERAEAFLATLGREHPGLRILVRDVTRDPRALARLQALAAEHRETPRVPSFLVRGQWIVGYSDESGDGQRIVAALGDAGLAGPAGSQSCEAEAALSCGPETAAPAASEVFAVELFRRRITLEQAGLPVFTVVLGLLDGFNPCSLWVLILMISLLAPMKDRLHMLAIAGTFVAVEGIAYFAFMAAWLNLFVWIGVSRVSELVIAAIALLAGSIHLKDFWAYGRGISLSIPASAKPGIYARMRRILQAENLWGAMVGAIVLAVLVQFVELLCTSGFPALYTRILTLRQLGGAEYYAYLLLYNLAYMLDDVIVLGIGVVTLSQRRLQENEGRWLKLVSGAVMVGLGLYLIGMPR
ncbi:MULTISPECIES: glutaredoxin family protein [Methylococcus]|jgi:glutaredoxin|uniref:glutaredoxin family protein n=1 Tax=Methylococcus TaxID=413 RepID=UPI001C529B77|nr:glutaredoxin domain-containing protein [Methylococcus capsulatus]QXP86735.1 glutaredoxin family protein [Methylococcus capsulatus]QXP91939.1 glutaredoxin family protein [Methylococcus capsulatus]QXP93587.1 glutaredoxin family protein [Methylococcus capsulatus]UQN11704.1 glutaredoxin family protein [Methylococcus capsulatus]